MARRTWEQYEKYILQQWPLTRREVEVTIECIKGRKNKEIASVLGIGAETVNKTLDHIYRATGVNGRDQLVAKLLIADIENTPLQQALTLAGEGSALVGAGFLATLYTSRSERKRPRSIRSGLVTSKRAAVKDSDPFLPASGLNKKQRAASQLTAENLSPIENSSQHGVDPMAWMISDEPQLESAAVDS